MPASELPKVDVNYVSYRKLPRRKANPSFGIRCHRHARDGQNCVVLNEKNGVSLSYPIDAVVHRDCAAVSTGSALIQWANRNCFVIVNVRLLGIHPWCG